MQSFDQSLGHHHSPRPDIIGLERHIRRLQENLHRARLEGRPQNMLCEMEDEIELKVVERDELERELQRRNGHLRQESSTDSD